jgi:transcriptional regulator with XRE-family HTH domain
MTSFRFSIDPRSRLAARFLRRTRSEIQKALLEEKAERKLSQADLARILGVDRSVVNRQLTGKGNLTLRSVADLAWALNRDIEIRFVKPDTEIGDNKANRETPEMVLSPLPDEERA